ncbi:unnamed protein product [Gongylonema pulchrum]|uniref:SMAP domain-containing protein n=1 Tax=Gongylonema pulchrum TaxID=637853 RepID=A0A183E4R8_9BILA|nr:unnamed protein product [Gongylonema pulchrum]
MMTPVCGNEVTITSQPPLRHLLLTKVAAASEAPGNLSAAFGFSSWKNDMLKLAQSNKNSNKANPYKGMLSKRKNQSPDRSILSFDPAKSKKSSKSDASSSDTRKLREMFEAQSTERELFGAEKFERSGISFAKNDRVHQK